MDRPRLLGSSSRTIQSHNMRAILLSLLRHGALSRVRLAQVTGLSATTITNQVSRLLDQGILVEGGTEQANNRRGVGRPQTTLRLEPKARFVIAVHIDVDHIRIALADLFAQPEVLRVQPLQLPQSAQATLDQIDTLIREVIQQSNIQRERILGFGIGMSGLVDTEEGVNVFAPNLGWHGVQVRDYFMRSFNLPVMIDNGVRAMALGEIMFGNEQDAHMLAFVYARVGVGAGFVIDGKTYRGSGAGAGEIGHTTVILEGGKECRCGNSGCLETLVSEPAMIALAKEISQTHPRGILAQQLAPSASNPEMMMQIFQAARDGDTFVQDMIAERARYLGIALANLVNIINPEVIVLGGLFAKGHDLLIPHVEKTIRERAFANIGETVRVIPTSFDDQVGVVGAAALALDAFFYQQDELMTSLMQTRMIL